MIIIHFDSNGIVLPVLQIQGRVKTFIFKPSFIWQDNNFKPLKVKESIHFITIQICIVMIYKNKWEGGGERY